MNTITTKQLRENMPKIISDLHEGRAVQLTYRHKVVATLQPTDTSTEPLQRGSPEAVLGFLKTADFGKIPKRLQNPGYDIKKQIADLRQADLNKKLS